LEEDRIKPAQGEMEEANLSEKVTEQQVSQENKTAELNFVARWQVEATEKNDGMGDLVDRPIFQEEVQLRRLHKESQPLEKLDKVIEEIISLMSSLAVDTTSNKKLSRRELARVAGQQQQQQRSRGADVQLQGKVWDPGGFQHWRRGAYDQKTMIFPDEEYDVGVSLHVSSVPSSQHI
jgi:hypothetical protein